MFSGTTRPAAVAIAESADNLAPLPLGQAILVLLTCDDQSFAEAMASRMASSDYASHALNSLSQTLRKSDANTNAHTLKTILHPIFEEATKQLSIAGQYRVGKLLRWIQEKQGDAFVSVLRNDLKNRAANSMGSSAGKESRLLSLGASIAVRILLSSYITTGAIYAQKTKAQIKKAYLASKRLPNSAPLIEEDDFAPKSDLSGTGSALLSELDPSELAGVLQLFDLVVPFVDLASSCTSANGQFTILAVSCVDTALMLILFVLKAHFQLQKLSEDDSLELHADKSLQTASPSFAKSLGQIISRIAFLQSKGYESIRPIFAYALDALQDSIASEVDLESPELISALYMTLDLWIPQMIEDSSRESAGLPATTPRTHQEQLHKFLETAAPLARELEAQSTVPRRRLDAICETLDRLYIAFALFVGKSGAKRLQSALSSSSGSLTISQLIHLIKTTIFNSKTSISIRISVVLARNFADKFPAIFSPHRLSEDLLVAFKNATNTDLSSALDDFSSFCYLDLILLHDSGAKEAESILRGPPSSELRLRLIKLLLRSSSIYYERSEAARAVLSTRRLDTVLASAGIPTDASRWDSAILSSFPIVKISVSQGKIGDTFQSIAEALLAETPHRELSAASSDLLTELLSQSSHTEDLFSRLLDLGRKKVNQLDAKSSISQNFLKLLITCVEKLQEDVLCNVAQCFFEQVRATPSEPVLMRGASALSPFFSREKVAKELFHLCSQEMRAQFDPATVSTDRNHSQDVLYAQLAPLLVLRTLDPACFALQSHQDGTDSDLLAIHNFLIPVILTSEYKDEVRKIAAELLARFPFDLWWTEMNQYFTAKINSPTECESVKVVIFVLCNRVLTNSSDVEAHFRAIFQRLDQVCRAVAPEGVQTGLSVVQRAVIDFFALCIASSFGKIKEQDVQVKITSLRESVGDNPANFDELLIFIIEKLDFARLSSFAARQAAQEDESSMQHRLLLLNSLISASKLISDQNMLTKEGKRVIDIFGRVLLPILFELVASKENYAIRSALLQLVFSLSFHMRQSALTFAKDLRNVCFLALSDVGNANTRLAGLKLLGSTMATSPEVWERDPAAFLQTQQILLKISSSDPSTACKQLASQLVQAIMPQ